MNEARRQSLRQVLLSAAVLGAFGVLGAALVAFTWSATADRIARNEREAFLRNVHQLVPQESMDNDLLQDVITIRASTLSDAPVQVYRARRGGRPVALVFSPVQRPGYAGPIRLMVAVMADGTLGGVRVLSHSETPGLGDKIEPEKSDWILGFTGRSLTDPPPDEWKVKKDGGVFDQFTGATITPRKVVQAVHDTLVYFQKEKERLFQAPAQPEPPTPVH